jgi:hypothetical protein
MAVLESNVTDTPEEHHEVPLGDPIRTREYEVTPWELLLDSDSDDTRSSLTGQGGTAGHRVSYPDMPATLTNRSVSRAWMIRLLIYSPKHKKIKTVSQITRTLTQ